MTATPGTGDPVSTGDPWLTGNPGLTSNSPSADDAALLGQSSLPGPTQGNQGFIYHQGAGL